MQKYATFRDASLRVRLKLALYYGQRIVTSRIVRRISNRIVLAALRVLHKDQASPQARNNALAADLNTTGFAALGKFMSDAQCGEILRYLDDKTMVDVRGQGHRFTLHDVPDAVTLGDYPLETIVDCPHMLQTANHPDIIALMTAYLGFKPTIVSLGLRWSFPHDAPADTVQRFHRDSEPGSAKLLIYLTDVDPLSGPHVYIEGTHRARLPLRMHPYPDEDVARKHGSGRFIEGAAGTAFIIDTKGIHKGAAPTQRARLMLSIQYALLPCFLYVYAPLKCKRAGQFDAYVNRLMITDDPEQRAIPDGLADDLRPDLANAD